MPNIKSAIKRVKVADKKRLRNKDIKITLRTRVKNARRAVDFVDIAAPETSAALASAISYIDIAAGKGIIHKNAAARRKSRLIIRFNKAQTSRTA